MTRRRIGGLALLLVGMAAAAYFILLRGPAPVSEVGTLLKRKPRSLVLITVDTTRPDHLEPYGAENVKTPRLQRLAREGIVMEKAYAVAPLTLPAHTAILTGLYPPQTGVRNNGTHFVPGELTTLTERLSEAGYRTGAFVSAAVLERRYGLDQGFEIYDDDMSRFRVRNQRVVPDRPGEFTVAAARGWLDTLEADERFFLWVHFFDPHFAYNPPPPYRDSYRTNLYGGEIAYMDAQIAELLSHPRIRRESGMAITVIGDHGESFGEHREQTHGLLPYLSTLHVPWILWVDDGPRGIRLRHPVSQVDLAPTLLDLVGLPESDGMSGRSLLLPVLPERSLYSEAYMPYYTYGWAKLHVMRRGRWEYIDAPEAELYDLRRDPRELSNQLERREEIARDLRRTLEEFRREVAPEGEQEHELAIDEESIAKLRALGYISMSSPRPSVDGDRPDPKAMIQLHTTLERARDFLIEDRYRKAANLLEEYLRKDPTNLAAMADLALARLGLKESDRAVEVIERALGLDPDHQQLLLMLARIEGNRQQGEKALALADRVLELNPKSMSAWSLKARMEARMGHKAAAAATIERALEMDPRHPAVNAIYAVTVEMPAGRYEEAERRLRQATARDRFQPMPWRGLGSLLEHLGRHDEAEMAYRQGLEHQPDEGSLHALLAVLVARRGHPDAEAHLREAMLYESEFRNELYVSLAAVLKKKGRLEEAEELYTRVLEVSPNRPEARNNRAIAAARSGRMDEALAELRALTDEHPDYSDAHNNLAVLLLGRGDPSGAEKHARRTVELTPAVAEAWGVLGAALQRQGRPREALAALDRALELKPASWSAHLNRGLVRIELGDAEGGRDDLEAALTANGLLPDAYFELARLYDDALGDRRQARRYYRAFLDRFPEDRRAEAARERIADLLPPSS